MNLRKLSWVPTALSVVFGAGCGREDRSEAPESPSAEERDTSAFVASETNVTYSIHEEQISDTPVKTQIEEHVVASSVPTKSDIEREILRRYRAAKQRDGFRYHNPATNIYIYVYGTEEQASAGQGLWIGMLASGPRDVGEPQVVFSEERLAALSQGGVVRFGLSEQERKELFRGIFLAEDRAREEATTRVPDTEIMKQIELQAELGQAYKAELARKYALTEDQLRDVISEGVAKGWPH